MAQQSFELFVSAYIDEAIDAQGIGLETDLAALEAMAADIGARLPDCPRLILREPYEVINDEDLLQVPIIEHGVLDEPLITASVATALKRLRHDQDRIRIEDPAFWAGLGGAALGIGSGLVMHNVGPAAAGAGVFMASTGFILYANRWRDPTPGDLSRFKPPIAVEWPKPAAL